MLDYVNLICDVPNDIVHVRNGRELFLNNTVIEKFPELMECGSFTSCYKMCYGCTALQTVPWLSTHNVTDFIYAFYGCTKLTVASLLSVLNALADLTGTGLSRKITLGSRNTAKLTAAQLAIATDKGWILG